MLMDPFGRQIEYLRISVTDRCDLRCQYCIPKGYTDFEDPKDWLSFDEIERIVRQFAILGIGHIRLTGGEPLLRKNLPLLAQKIKAIPGIVDLSVSTNATQLNRFAQPLKEAGVDRLNISLDGLNRECVQKISGSDSLSAVMAGLSEAKKAGFSPIKINMVVLPNQNVDQINPMVEFCMREGFVLRLIENMPMGQNAQQQGFVSLNEIINELKQRWDLQETESKKPMGAGPARYLSNKNGDFSIGFITPMSQHFCETCNRIRLSVDGTLYLCLGQDSSLPLRIKLREGIDDPSLQALLKASLSLKPERHEFLEKPQQIIRLMSKTGG